MSLQNATKFYLVDPSQIKQGESDENEFKKRTKPLHSKELQSLDKRMLAIINDPTLSTDQKVNRYNSVLAQFQTASSTTQNPFSINFTNTTPQSLAKEFIPTGNYDPLFGIPKQYKTKANNLWSALKDLDQLKVSTDGSVTINKEPITGGNITDMVYKAVNPKLKNRYVQGWEEFKGFLDSANVPKSFLATDTIPNSSISEKRKVTNLRSKSRAAPYDKDPFSEWEAHDRAKI